MKITTHPKNDGGDSKEDSSNDIDSTDETKVEDFDETSIPTGEKGGSCYGNGTCNTGLLCNKNFICIIKIQQDDNDILKGPFVEILHANKKDTCNIKIPVAENIKENFIHKIVVFDYLQNWNVTDIGNVYCGIDSYIDPSHYNEPKRFRKLVY